MWDLDVVDPRHVRRRAASHLERGPGTAPIVTWHAFTEAKRATTVGKHSSLRIAVREHLHLLLTNGDFVLVAAGSGRLEHARPRQVVLPFERFELERLARVIVARGRFVRSITRASEIRTGTVLDIDAFVRRRGVLFGTRLRAASDQLQ